MECGEVAKMDPEVLAWALMGMGELLGMRWIVWEGAEEVPDELLEQMGMLIERVLGAWRASRWRRPPRICRSAGCRRRKWRLRAAFRSRCWSRSSLCAA